MTRPAKRTFSIKRLRTILIVALVVGVTLFTAVMFGIVGNLSERFGPEVRADLEWRASRGAQELVHAIDIGLAVGDATMVTEGFGIYARSQMSQRSAVDTSGKVIAQHGTAPREMLFVGPPGVVSSSERYLSSWAPAMIEGAAVGKVAIVVSTQRLREAEARLTEVTFITLAAGGVALVLGVCTILLFTRAIDKRNRKVTHYANNLEQMVELRTAELDERNREMRLVLDSVAQGFVMVDAAGRIGPEHSAIVDAWFGAPAPDVTFAAFIEPHAPEFAAWFEMTSSTLRDGYVPLELCLAQMPKRFSVGGRAFEVTYRTIMEDDYLDRLLVIISDVTAEMVRQRSEREQRELLGMFQRISSDRAGVEELVTEVKELLEVLASPCDLVVERRVLHTLKGNCALFGLELFSELCHTIESEIADTNDGVSETQRKSLFEAWQTVASWIDRLRGASRENVVEIERSELAQVIERANKGVSGHELASALTLWTLEPVAKRLERLGHHARGLARRLCKGELEVAITDGGVRMDGAPWSAFWAAAVHAVRNSVDHGIEHPDERAEVGKPAVAKLALTAAREPGWITSRSPTTVAASTGTRSGSARKGRAFRMPPMTTWSPPCSPMA